MNTKIRVLLVDDHACFRHGMRALLGYEDDIEIVGEAADGRDALRKAVELHPDVVLMDIAMPELNGIEATRQLVRENPAAKVIALSMYSSIEYVDALVKNGAVGYLTKYADGAEVARAIREVQKGGACFSPSIARHLLQIQTQNFENGKLRNNTQSALTPREAETLQLIAEGFPNKIIASKLCISIKTVEKHRQQLMNKLRIHSIAGLTRYAMENGVIQCPSQNLQQ